MESVMHFTSLLYEGNRVNDLSDTDGDEPPSPSVGGFSTKKPSVTPGTAKNTDGNADLAPDTETNTDTSHLHPISEIEKKRVINKAKRCLQWAQDADRPPVPGAANMTDDQV